MQGNRRDTNAGQDPTFFHLTHTQRIHHVIVVDLTAGPLETKPDQRLPAAPSAPVKLWPRVIFIMEGYIGPSNAYQNLRITIDGKRKQRFGPGDLISGSVHVTPRRPKTARVAVHLKARLQCIIAQGGFENETLYPWTVYLFKFSQTLFEGPDLHTLATNNRKEVSLPFQFRFPWSVLEEAPFFESRPLGAREGFEHYAGHQLPPSSTCSCTNKPQEVQYYIEAVTATSKLSSPQQTLQYFVRFLPLRQEESPDPALRRALKEFTCHSRLLDPAMAAARHRWTRLFSQDGSAPIPWATFQIAVEFPTVVRAGEPLPLRLDILHLDRCGSLVEPPPVILRSLHARLTVHTKVRVPVSSNEEHELVAASKQKFQLLNQRFATPRAIYSGMSLAEHYPHLVVDTALAPAFESYGISLWHDFKLTLQVECVGKVFDFEAASHTPFAILSPHYRARDPPPQYVRDPAADAANVGDYAMVEAPSYDMSLAQSAS